MVSLFSLSPVSESCDYGVVRMFRDLEACWVKSNWSTVNMVWASRSPASVLWVLCNSFHNSWSVLLILAYDFHLTIIAIWKGSAWHTVDSKNVGKRPGVIKRVDGEQRHLNKRMQVLSKHALPFLFRVSLHTLFCWWINLFVNDRHEILELWTIVMLFVEVVSWIQEDSWIWNWPDCWIWHLLTNIVCP